MRRKTVFGEHRSYCGKRLKWPRCRVDSGLHQRQRPAHSGVLLETWPRSSKLRFDADDLKTWFQQVHTRYYADIGQISNLLSGLWCKRLLQCKCPRDCFLHSQQRTNKYTKYRGLKSGQPGTGQLLEQLGYSLEHDAIAHIVAKDRSVQKGHPPPIYILIVFHHY